MIHDVEVFVHTSAINTSCSLAEMEICSFFSRSIDICVVCFAEVIFSCCRLLEIANNGMERQLFSAFSL